MLLGRDKFDVVLTNNDSRDLGCDERSGRFFEVLRATSSSPPSPPSSSAGPVVDDIDEGDATTTNNIMTRMTSGESTTINECVDATNDARYYDDDVPPTPGNDFAGMEIATTVGTINGVRLTSSSSSSSSYANTNAASKRSPAANERSTTTTDVEEDDDDYYDDDALASSSTTFGAMIAGAGAVSAAAMATAAVNAAVSMRTLSAPSVDKSYVSLGDDSSAGGYGSGGSAAAIKAVDDDGLPLTYDRELIERYWRKERGALNERWSYFVGKAVPFLTRLVTLYISEGKIDERHIPSLSRRARLDLQDLGPTFIKAGQMMSVRPDVLPQVTLDELTMLQDSVVRFDTAIAVKQIEDELGGPLGQFFTSISEEPVAAASLAQVYLATLNDGKDTRVAVKVQRPNVLSTVSKDLYVLRRAAEVFQGLVERFAPQQKTNYVALLNEWAIGFYTELDFANEARNQRRLRTSLIDAGISGITVPDVYEEMCTRRVLVSEWMDGRKLSECDPNEIAEVTAIAQEAFLTQLFGLGFFHGEFGFSFGR